MFTSVTHIRQKTSWTILQRIAPLYLQYSMPQDKINSHNMTTRQKLRSCARYPEMIRVTNNKPLYNLPTPYTTIPVTSKLLSQCKTASCKYWVLGISSILSLLIFFVKSASLRLLTYELQTKPK